MRSITRGPQSPISFTGGWCCRKSPPYTVSSKCSHSLSPCCRVRSLTLLMPPWAQTLCERFTGTRLIRSTSMPSSANFIEAASPAKPPPTIRTLCFAIFLLTHLLTTHLLTTHLLTTHLLTTHHSPLTYSPLTYS